MYNRRGFPAARVRTEGPRRCQVTPSVTGWTSSRPAITPRPRQLWERYFHRLVALARTKLQGQPRRMADEEDVALSAFDSFCRAAEQGRFPQLEDRDDLWRVLVTLTAWKAQRLVRDQRRQKRGGGNVLGESALAGLAEAKTPGGGLNAIVGQEPTPEFAAQVTEECLRLLDHLGSAELRSIALWKMEGYTTEEIAGQLRRASRTIERKLQIIRDLWEQEVTACP